jgi:hypothetical protein
VKRSRGGTLVLLAASTLLLAAMAGARPVPAVAGLDSAGLDSASLDSAVQVSAAGPVRTVASTLFDLNGVNTTGPQWNNPALDKVLGAYAPGMLRYPGGTSANYWDWQVGWFQPGSWPSEPSTP